MEYIKNLISCEQQNGLVLRFSSHLALFYRTASYQTNVSKKPKFVHLIASH